MYGVCHTFLDEISDALKGSKSVQLAEKPAGPTAAFPWAYEKAAWKK
jgi:hypothetical protein